MGNSSVMAPAPSDAVAVTAPLRLDARGPSVPCAAVHTLARTHAEKEPREAAAARANPMITSRGAIRIDMIVFIHGVRPSQTQLQRPYGQNSSIPWRGLGSCGAVARSRASGPKRQSAPFASSAGDTGFSAPLSSSRAFWAMGAHGLEFLARDRSRDPPASGRSSNSAQSPPRPGRLAPTPMALVITLADIFHDAVARLHDGLHCTPS